MKEMAILVFGILRVTRVRQNFSLSLMVGCHLMYQNILKVSLEIGVAIFLVNLLIRNAWYYFDPEGKFHIAQLVFVNLMSSKIPLCQLNLRILCSAIFQEGSGTFVLVSGILIDIR